MTLIHHHVPVDRRPEVARALIAASDNPIHEVRTSGEGFYAPDEVWAKAAEAFESADEQDDTETPSASAEDATSAGQPVDDADAAVEDATTSQAPTAKTTKASKTGS